jgi:phospholipid transport system substrate-binding protein
MMLAFVLLVAAVNPSPKAQLQATIEEVRQVLKSGDALTTKQGKLRAITKSYVDFSKLAQNTLDAQWAKLNAKQRVEFSKLLEDLVDASYINRISESSTVDITLNEEKIDGDTAHVTAIAHVKGSDTDLGFDLKKSATQWTFSDVVLDDVSLTNNYRAQFSKTINKDGYPALVAKLKKKVTELKTAPSASAAR